MRALDSINLLLHLGVNTYFNPQTQAGRTLAICQNMDCYTEFQSLGKVPGSTTRADNAGSAVVSLHQFEYTDLFGMRQREHIELDEDGDLSLIDSGSGALTVLSTALVGETLRSAQMLNQLYLSSPSQRQLATGGVRYNGTEVHNWGVQPPDKDSLALEFPFDDATDWTANGCTLADSTDSIDGVGSVELTKTTAASALCFMQQDGISPVLDLDDAGASKSDFFYFWCFIPHGTLRLLNDGGAAVQVIIANEPGLTNSFTFDFERGELSPGWNLLSCDLLNPDSTAGSLNQLAVDTLKFSVVTDAVSSTPGGFLFSYMHKYEGEGSLDAAIGAAGLVDGDVTYRLSFVTEDGLESNVGPASASLTAASDQVALINIATSTDPQVIARRIYRDHDGDGVYRLVTQINDATSTTTYTDNTSLAALGNADAPIAGDDLIDNSPPPRFRALHVHENRIFGIDADNPVILHIGEVGIPGAWRIVDQLSFDEELVAVEGHVLGLMIYGRDRTYFLTGDGALTAFRATEVNPQLGANNYRSSVRIRSLNVVMREAEVFLVEDADDPWFIGGPVLDKFKALTPSDTFIIHDRSRYRILFFEIDNPEVIYFQYGTRGFQQITGDGSGTDPLDLRVGAWGTLSLPSSVKPRCAVQAERTAETPELWIGCDDGRVYHLQDPAAFTYATNSSTAAVAAQFETIPIPIGAGTYENPQAPASVSGRGEPRYLRAVVNSTSTMSWQFTISLMEDAGGAVIGTQTVVVSFPAGDYSTIVPIPYVGHRGAWCKVFASSSTGAISNFRALELFYHPRSRFSGGRS